MRSHWPAARVQLLRGSPPTSSAGTSGYSQEIAATLGMPATASMRCSGRKLSSGGFLDLPRGAGQLFGAAPALQQRREGAPDVAVGIALVAQAPPEVAVG